MAPKAADFRHYISMVISIWFRKVNIMRPASLAIAWSTAAFQSVGENSGTTSSLLSRELRKTSMECRFAFRAAHSASMVTTRVAAFRPFGCPFYGVQFRRNSV